MEKYVSDYRTTQRHISDDVNDLKLQSSCLNRLS